ncbi:MAG: methyltransferase domain-containing protein [Gammaproteobacteria bacterium]|nr:methyltransferase domain-containing protein [Gammaproteobacteria bacterium]
MLRQHVPSSCHVIGVDNSPAMIERCKANIERDHSVASVEILEQDLQQTPVDNASVVVLNFTLQFVPPAERGGILQRIYEGMTPGGALLLAEKIAFEDKAQHEFMTSLHDDFKRYHDYSDLEIAQKRAALENVMIPETVEYHTRRLQEAGFREHLTN